MNRFVLVAAGALLFAPAAPAAARQATAAAEDHGPFTIRQVVLPLVFPAELHSPATGIEAANVTPQAIEHSDAYYTRLKIHRIGSYTMLPLFAGQYLLGNALLEGDDPAGWVKSAHSAGAGAIGVLFAVNTVTGVWNLIESRNDPGKARRFLHAALMIAADAGFAYTASMAGDDGHDDLERHRDYALGSMAFSTAGVLMMWLWK